MLLTGFRAYYQDVRKFIIGNFLCFSAIGILGIFPFFSTPPPPPEPSIRQFAEFFVSNDANGIFKLMHADVVNGTDLSLSEIEGILTHYNSKVFRIKSVVIDKAMKAEDGSAERVHATITFTGPSFGDAYSKTSTLKMTQLWLLDAGKWWLERSISIDYVVHSDDRYPTAKQNENAIQFEMALTILDKLKLTGEDAESPAGPDVPGVAIENYRELEDLYKRERSSKGIDPKSEGLQLFMKASAKAEGGFLQAYYGDFVSGPEDRRKPMPFNMFRDYTQALITRASQLEKIGKTRLAAVYYKRLISFGNQLLKGPGGYQFELWGAHFQKIGAEGLSKITKGHEKAIAGNLARISARKIDLLMTAMSCLNSMSDYVSQKAAVIAANRSKDSVFMPWGINTLAIYAVKGAPADEAACKMAGGILIVSNPSMQKAASDALVSIGLEPSGKIKNFVDYQKAWVKNHDVYETPNLK